jgi:arylsulfatase A-like enzyme
MSATKQNIENLQANMINSEKNLQANQDNLQKQINVLNETKVDIVPPPSDKKPSIVIYMLDDFSKDFITAYNPLYVDRNGNSLTPNIDKFVKEDAMRWNRCYTPASICQSSRFMLNFSAYGIGYGMTETSQDSKAILDVPNVQVPADMSNTMYLVTTLPQFGGSYGDGYIEPPDIIFNGEPLDGVISQILPGGLFNFAALKHAPLAATVEVSSGNANVVAVPMPTNGAFHVKPYMLGEEFYTWFNYMRENGYHTSKLMKDNYGIDNFTINRANYDYIDTWQLNQPGGFSESGIPVGNVANYDLSQDFQLNPVFEQYDDGIIRNSWNLYRKPGQPFIVQINDYNVHQASTQGVTNNMQLIDNAAISAAEAIGVEVDWNKYDSDFGNPGILSAVTVVLTALGQTQESFKSQLENYFYFSGRLTTTPDYLGNTNMGKLGSFTAIFPYLSSMWTGNWQTSDKLSIAWMWASITMKSTADRHFEHLTQLLKGYVFDQGPDAPPRLDENFNVWDDTIFVVTGDHGSSTPIGKCLLTNQSLNVPFLMKWPKNFKQPTGFIPGGISDALISFVDFWPTFAAIAQIDTPLPKFVRGVPFMDANQVHKEPNKYIIATQAPGLFGTLKIAVINKEYLFVYSPLVDDSGETDIPAHYSNGVLGGSRSRFILGLSGELLEGDIITGAQYTESTEPFIYKSAKLFKSGTHSDLFNFLFNKTQKYELYKIPSGFDYLDPDGISHFKNIANSNPVIVGEMKKIVTTFINSYNRIVEWNGTDYVINFITRGIQSPTSRGFGINKNDHTIDFIANLLKFYPSTVDSNDIETDGVPYTADFFGNVDDQISFDKILKVIYNAYFTNNSTIISMSLQQNIPPNQKWQIVRAKTLTSELNSYSNLVEPEEGEKIILNDRRERILYDILGRFTILTPSIAIFGPNTTVTVEELVSRTLTAQQNNDPSYRQEETSIFGLITPADLTQAVLGNQPWNTIEYVSSITAGVDETIVIVEYIDMIHRYDVVVCNQLTKKEKTRYVLMGDDLSQTSPARFDGFGVNQFGLTYEFVTYPDNKTENILNIEFDFRIGLTGKIQYTEWDSDNPTKYNWELVNSGTIETIENGYSFLLQAFATGCGATPVNRYDGF